MVSEKELEIFEKINFTFKYLKIRQKYKGDGKSFWLSNKTDILKAFKSLKLEVNYISGGAYVVKRKYKDYCFEYHFVISKNNFSTYTHIYVNDVLLEGRVSNIASVLRYIPYDHELAEEINVSGFLLNSIDSIMNYVNDIIRLLNEFVDEYIKEATE